jgi:hypothetical protein
VSETDLGGQTITVLVRADTGTKDVLGVPVLNTTPTDQPGCSVQPRYTSEHESSVDFTRSMWIVFAPPSALIMALKATDAVEYLGDTFEVYGDPMPWPDETGVIDYVRFELRKARG